MNGVMERLPGFPALPELFGWVEGGIPWTPLPAGLHGIRIEEHLKDGIYVLRAELPGIDSDKDVTVHADGTIVEAARTMAAHRVERLPVLDEEDRSVGTVTRSDLLQVFLRPDDRSATTWSRSS
ncbi:CBS domain-containing protein [Streptomyces sp. NPDC006654]|uniref:CBS domain-containing protein n=1 Tax=Streptomyces sp. NPDC006654 TaxID=3156897 RepID=UPI003402A2B4